jgi:hypothetical protein
MKVLLLLNFGGKTKSAFSKIAELPPGLSPFDGMKLQDGNNDTLQVTQVTGRLAWKVAPEMSASVVLNCNYIDMKLANLTPKSLKDMGWKRLL